jgi:hypothetical protein
MQVKGTVKVFAYANNVDAIERSASQGKHDEVCSALMYSTENMSHRPDWTEVGVATITVDFFPREASDQINNLTAIAA